MAKSIFKRQSIRLNLSLAAHLLEIEKADPCHCLVASADDQEIPADELDRRSNGDQNTHLRLRLDTVWLPNLGDENIAGFR